MDLERSTIFITGAAKRVGAVIAMTLAQAGAKHIILHYHRSAIAAGTLAGRLIKLGTKQVSLISADLSDHEDVKDLAQTVKRIAPDLDAIVFNASVYEKTPLGRVSEAAWNAQFDVNLKSVFFLSQELGVPMRKRGGKIVLLGDWSGLRPYADYIPYCLSKTGILYLTHALAKALAPKVMVNCILPGPVLMPESAPASFARAAKTATLLKRLGKPEDVAKAVRFFLKDADFSTGSWLTVDGGRLIA